MATFLYRSAECLLLAQSGHHAAEFQCLLSGVKRTSRERTSMSANDPKRTLVYCVQKSFAEDARPLNHYFWWWPNKPLFELDQTF